MIDAVNEKYGQLMESMLEDMLKAPACFQPTNFWSSSLVKILKDINAFGIETFHAHPSSLQMYVPVYNPAAILPSQEAINQLHTQAKSEVERLYPFKTEAERQELIQKVTSGEVLASQHYQIFKNYDFDVSPVLSDFSEAPIGHRVELFEWQEKKYSRSALNYLRALTLMKAYIDSEKIDKVMEIGGGYGTLGEIILKSKQKPLFYIDIDIPPVACVATYYLQKVFGEENVADYSVTRDLQVIDIEELRQRYRAVVLCPWQLPKIKGSCELFVNMYSFQEMEPEVVQNYASYVDKLVTHFVLLKNSRAGKTVAKEKGQIGVFEPTTRDHYLQYFSSFDALAIDSKVFGEAQDDFASEVMVMARKGLEE